jgi:hypothetical protein
MLSNAKLKMILNDAVILFVILFINMVVRP